MQMDNLEVERKLTVIREYLVTTLAQSSVSEGATLDGEPTFSVTCAGTRTCTIRVSSTLLSDRHPTPMELGWALQDNHIAEKAMKGSAFYLNHEAVPECL
jgi:hypothetical protein